MCKARTGVVDVAEDVLGRVVAAEAVENLEEGGCVGVRCGACACPEVGEVTVSGGAEVGGPLGSSRFDGCEEAREDEAEEN